MRSETKWNCLQSQWLCLVCHHTQLSSALLPLGFLSSQPSRGHNWVSDNSPKLQSCMWKLSALFHFQEEIFLYFQYCISSLHIAKAEMFSKSSWVAPVWCTPSMQTLFSFFLPVTCSKGCVICSQAFMESRATQLYTQIMSSSKTQVASLGFI